MKKRTILRILVYPFFVLPQMAFAAVPTSISGKDVVSTKIATTSSAKKKGMVVIFLSASCPCSNSHISELKDLAKSYAEFSFVGVHSNADENQEMTTKYFKNVGLNFPVIQDDHAKLANDFKALKTPHAYIVLEDGKIAYQGGVSSSHDFSSADRKYLREALEDLSGSRSVRTPEGRTLGCAIARGG